MPGENPVTRVLNYRISYPHVVTKRVYPQDVTGDMLTEIDDLNLLDNGSEMPGRTGQKPFHKVTYVTFQRSKIPATRISGNAAGLAHASGDSFLVFYRIICSI